MSKEQDQKALEEEQQQAEELEEETEGAEEIEEERDQRGMKAYRNEGREAIVKKAREKRQQDLSGDADKLDPDGKELQEAMEAEVRGEPNLFDAEYEEEETAAKEPEKPAKEPEALDSPDDMVTITVDGEERQVSRADVEQAGIAAMQKLSSADKRMKEVSAYEKSVKNLEASVQKQLEDMQAQMQAQPAEEGTKAGDSEANLPDAGAVAETVKEQVAKVSEAIYAGDQDQVTEALATALTSVAQGRQGSTPPLDAKQFAEAVMVNMRTMADEEQAERAAAERTQVAEKVNTTFEQEFPELYADDRGFRLTKAEFDALCEEKPLADRVELMREAAGVVNKLVNPPVDDELARRKSRKRAAESPSTSKRMPTKEPPRTKTRKDVVAEMQRQRGQRTG